MSKQRLLTLALLTVFGVLLLTAASCSEVINENSKSDGEVSQLMSDVRLGMSQGEVRAILGEPNHKQQMNTEGYRSDCWYYGSTGSWQLCFDTGLMEDHPLQLTSKNHY
jgi:outer membrane protein assembly factor BamE (lipoprotein component of BamABCDE complex)